MPSLIGTGQDQVPTNGLLGSMAFVDAEAATFQLAGNGTENLDPVTLQQLNTEKYGRLLDVKILTGSGVYTPTTGTKSIVVELQGGGGGASGIPTTTTSQIGVSVAGQTGGYLKVRVTSGFSDATYSVGAGGAGGAVAGANGNSGDQTTFTVTTGTIIAARGFSGLFTSQLANTGSYIIESTNSSNLNSFPATGVQVIENISSGMVDHIFVNVSGLSGISTPPQGRFSRHIPKRLISSGTSTIQGDKGFGLGGQGATRVNTAGAFTSGDAGSAGTIIIYEYA
jgi:hypothetical protein